MHGYAPSSAYTLYLPALESPAPVRGVASEVSRFRKDHALALQRAHSRLVVDAQHRRDAAMPPRHRLPHFKVGDHVCISVAHLPKDEYDSKLSTRFVGPFRIASVPHPFVYSIDFGFKFPHVHPRVSANLLRPFVQPSTCALRFDEPDYPLVGDGSRPIEILMARRAGRGRPPQHGRPSYQYKIRFRNLDALYDCWMTEKELRCKHPDSAPSLIADCDARHSPV